ncbi:zinc transporter [Allopseudospirillum japonicum]|uniref:Zinc transporter n=1 Tax=Allopseudospirillum japonicum TaxID=64971 RepID=A0A1H6TYR4_9GAMM|nr:zinc transporter ZntB [Allopseudospirillum japonicum]SEI84336.1 zinc transporter [Allopseudospirillum japonicum]
MQLNTGLVYAYLFQKNQGKQLKASEIPAWQAQEGLLWLHLDYTEPEIQSWLNEAANLDPMIVEALIATETRPRCTPFQNGFLLLLRGVNLNPEADPEDMVSIRLWVEKDRIISTRKRQLQSVQDLLRRIEQQQAPNTPGEFIAALTENLTWRMRDTIEGYEETLADLEEKVLSGGHDEVKNELSTLRRHLITLRRYLAPQRDALTRLHTEKFIGLTESERLQIRETTDRLIRYLEDLDAMRERAMVMHEEILSQLSELGNQRMYLLSMITAIFLPLGFFTGLLGINVGGMPGADHPYAFWWVCAGIFMFVIVLVLMIRKKRWL